MSKLRWIATLLTAAAPVSPAWQEAQMTSGGLTPPLV